MTDTAERPVETWGQLTITESPSYRPGEVRASVLIGGDWHSAFGATFAEAAASLRAHLDTLGRRHDFM